jgi:hypothetical protein
MIPEMYKRALEEMPDTRNTRPDRVSQMKKRGNDERDDGILE